MDCPECKNLMEEEYYHRGRREYLEHYCNECGFGTYQRTRKLPNNPSDALKKGCAVKWGKSKTHKFPTKKKYKKKRRGY